MHSRSHQLDAPINRVRYEMYLKVVREIIPGHSLHSHSFALYRQLSITDQIVIRKTYGYDIKGSDKQEEGQL